MIVSTHTYRHGDRTVLVEQASFNYGEGMDFMMLSLLPKEFHQTLGNPDVPMPTSGLLRQRQERCYGIGTSILTLGLGTSRGGVI